MVRLHADAASQSSTSTKVFKHIYSNDELDTVRSHMCTLHFGVAYIVDHASRYNTTPVITFAQQLWWLFYMAQPSPRFQIILTLGGFHTEMSFLGSIGSLMAGTGLMSPSFRIPTPGMKTNQRLGWSGMPRMCRRFCTASLNKNPLQRFKRAV